MKFFREPRLGCYYAIDIRYQGSLQYSSLVNAIENYEEYKVKKEEEDKRNADIPEVYYDYADALTPYGIAVRYPNELGIEEHHVQNALLYAQEIVDWTEKIIRQKHI